MAKPPRPPMPKLPPFALSSVQPRRKRPHYLLVFFLVFAVPLLLVHLALLNLPYFWDELGQFIPTALDILHHGWLVPRSTVPNVHPPLVEAYLALVYRVFGYSIPVTRMAMLLIASAAPLLLFLLSIELSKGTKGVPAFVPPLLLLASPLFYTQSMMAQLDMPAMVFTLLALLLFVREEYALAAVASVALVLTKETGLVVPLSFLVVLLYRRLWKQASYFMAPVIALSAWLVYLHAQTGYWLGDPGFAHYNVGYALHPVRMALSFARRVFYIFVAEFRWIGTLVLVATAVRYRWFVTARREWRVTLLATGAAFVLVTVLGGAELERYLLPVLPIFYVAVSVALTYQRRRVNVVVIPALLGGLIASNWWNPPYPFPFENNLAMVDFVRLQETAAAVAERSLANKRIATAWPYTAALRRPEYGYVSKKLRVLETGDFHLTSIRRLPPADFDALIVYTRTWEPDSGVLDSPIVRHFLAHFYDWQPQITSDECRALGLDEVVSWQLRGQSITLYVRR